MATRDMAGVRTVGRLNTLVAGAVGAVFIIVGLLGFTVSGGHSIAGHTGGQLLGLFQVNSLHNLVHLAVGAVMVGAAIAGTRAARSANVAIGAVYLALGVVGLFITGDSPLNIVALNGADNGLHLVIGAVLVAVGMGADRR
jgi:Domain of unknown function (DUF4383)